MLDMSGLWAVLCLLIIAPAVLLGFALFLRENRLEADRKLNPKKRTVLPQKAFEQPGICTCDDGFNFHIDGGRCNVEGCPCVVYVPSTATREMLIEIETMGLSKLAITSSNFASEALKKLQALEERRAEVNAIEAPKQVGVQNKGAQCPDCRKHGSHQDWCSRQYEN